MSFQPSSPSLGTNFIFPFPSLPNPPPSDSEEPVTERHTGSYGQIIKSSSIIGGSQAINYLIGLARTKAVAIFIGPAGIGLVGLYQSAMVFVNTISAMGISSSAVKEIAEADGKGDEYHLAKTTKALRRICWATGMLGWMLTVLFAWPLSLWIFGSPERAWGIAILGVTLLLGSISAGQSALLQGKRRIVDLAHINIFSSLLSTAISISIYAWIGERGIIPAIALTAAINLACTWWFARSVQTQECSITVLEIWTEAKRMLNLGLAFMLSAVLTAGMALTIRSIITREYGLDANGVYQAAWSISGLFAGFIIGAMGTDFYPRLTAASNDSQQVNRMVNEQTEIGILLALPGLIGTLTFAPCVMHLFYSEKFVAGADLLPWFVFGVFGRVVSWPMAFIMVAKGEGRWFAVSEAMATLVYLVMLIALMYLFGLWGSALAFAGIYLLYTVAVYSIARVLTGFRWAPAAVRLLCISILLIASGFLTQKLLPQNAAYAIGGILTLTSAVYSMRGISARLGAEHRIVRLIRTIPGGNIFCGM